MAKIKIELGKERLVEEYMDELLGYHYPVVVTKRSIFLNKDTCTENHFSNPKFLEALRLKIREIFINLSNYMEGINDYTGAHKFRRVYLCKIKLVGRSSVTNDFEINCTLTSFGSLESSQAIGNVGLNVIWE